MAIRFPAISSAERVLCRSPSSGKHATSGSADVPKGYLAIYVGEETKKRFAVPLSFLSETAFQDLLNLAEEEFGFDHPMGGLTILSREDIFIDIASQLEI